MPNETHKLQEDPPEGSRETIEHELGRQREKVEAERRDEPKPKPRDRAE